MYVRGRKEGPARIEVLRVGQPHRQRDGRLSDKKFFKEENGSISVKADVLSSSDYYPFGLKMKAVGIAQMVTMAKRKTTRGNGAVPSTTMAFEGTEGLNQNDVNQILQSVIDVGARKINNDEK